MLCGSIKRCVNSKRKCLRHYKYDEKKKKIKTEFIRNITDYCLKIYFLLHRYDCSSTNFNLLLLHPVCCLLFFPRARAHTYTQFLSELFFFVYSRLVYFNSSCTMNSSDRFYLTSFTIVAGWWCIVSLFSYSPYMYEFTLFYFVSAAAATCSSNTHKYIQLRFYCVFSFVCVIRIFLWIISNAEYINVKL